MRLNKIYLLTLQPLAACPKSAQKKGGIRYNMMNEFVCYNLGFSNKLSLSIPFPDLLKT